MMCAHVSFSFYLEFRVISITLARIHFLTFSLSLCFSVYVFMTKTTVLDLRLWYHGERINPINFKRLKGRALCRIVLISDQ